MYRIVRTLPQMLTLQLSVTWRLVRTIMHRRRRRMGMTITSVQRACSRRTRSSTTMMQATGEGFCCASPLTWLVAGDEIHRDLLRCAMQSHKNRQPSMSHKWHGEPNCHAGSLQIGIPCPRSQRAGSRDRPPSTRPSPCCCRATPRSARSARPQPPRTATATPPCPTRLLTRALSAGRPQTCQSTTPGQNLVRLLT